MSMPKKASSKGNKSSKGLSMPDVPSKKGKGEKMNDGTTSKKVDTKATKKGGDSSSKSGKGEVVKKMVDAKATKKGSSKSSKAMVFAKSSKGSAKSTKKLGSKTHKQAHSMPTRRLRGQQTAAVVNGEVIERYAVQVQANVEINVKCFRYLDVNIDRIQCLTHKFYDYEMDNSSWYPHIVTKAQDKLQMYT